MTCTEVSKPAARVRTEQPCLSLSPFLRAHAFKQWISRTITHEPVFPPCIFPDCLLAKRILLWTSFLAKEVILRIFADEKCDMFRV